MLYYYTYNAHGDVTGLANATGIITKTYSYDAFGVEKTPEQNDDNPFRYCGEYYDSSSGTYYLRNRNYDPRTGRFTSEDPIRSGLNWYTYCNNNPVAFIDPFGLEAYYIFYNDDTDRNPDGTVNNGSLQDRAEKEYKALIKAGVDPKDIYKKVISTEKAFSEEWANMSNGDDPIIRVALYFHSNPRAIIINGIKGQAVVTQLYMNDPNAASHLSISDLAQKNIYELTFYGCNTAHQDYAYENVAYDFINTQKQLSRAIGWDGSMRWSFWRGNPILAGKQGYFEDWRNNVNPNSTRKPIGRILYEKVWRLDDPSFPEYARQEILISPYKP